MNCDAILIAGCANGRSLRIPGQSRQSIRSTRRTAPWSCHLSLEGTRSTRGSSLTLPFLSSCAKGENELTEQLLKDFNSSGQIHCVPASIKGKYIIRFTITASSTNADDINRDWNIIQQTASKILHPLDSLSPQERRHKMKNLHDDFRMSLVLSNTPHSPCFINGSFAAILPLNTSHIYAMTHELSQRALKNSLLPISTRRRIKNGSTNPSMSKQMSVDRGMLTNEQQNKNLVSITPSSLPISRQGSLDSRVEEILENNSAGDNTNHHKTNTDLFPTYSNGHGDHPHHHHHPHVTIPKIIKE